MLKKPQNRHAFAKVGLYGEAGSGKTYTAANLAIGLHQFAKCTKPIAMFDTEPAASYIIPLFEKAGIEFLVYDESRALKDLMAFMDEAEKEASIVIVDSITHVWRDAQDSYLARMNEKRKQKGQSPIYQLEFHHWKPIKAAWQAFTDRFLSSKMHVFVCGRAGSIYEYQKNDTTNKMELITVGTKMATEKELGYEPSLLVEMVKRREDGHIVNTALVEKDRTDTLNGREIPKPTFEKLKPHFAFLNIGGEHFDSMDKRNSADMYTDEGDDRFSHELKQRAIECDKIKAIFIKYQMDGTSQSAKEKRVETLEKYFNTTSWTQIENSNSDWLKDCRTKMELELNTKEDAE